LANDSGQEEEIGSWAFLNENQRARGEKKDDEKKGVGGSGGIHEHRQGEQAI